MLNELKVKTLLKESLEKYIMSLESKSLYFELHEVACRSYMKVLNDDDMLNKYEILNIDNSKAFLKEVEEDINNTKVVRAINNIFKTNNCKVESISSNNIIVSKNECNFYTYQINDDYICIKNDKGIVEFEKLISGYQESF